MGNKIFVSYKYADSLVQELVGVAEKTTARHYVDAIQELLDEEDHINKGELDNEDMSDLADSTIASKIGDKIFDSTVTIVVISKGMKDPSLPEKEQWIPWEVSYSLREQSRSQGNSKTNAILAVVLPDETGKYDYYMRWNPQCKSRSLRTDFLFNILGQNMFNIKEPNTRECNGRTIYHGHSSYILSVKWVDFAANIDKYILSSIDIYKQRDKYNIKKNLT